MKTKIRIFLFAWLFSGFSSILLAQHHEDRVYFCPADSLVKQKLAWWQDQKFGLLMHWGPYSQWGVVETGAFAPKMRTGAPVADPIPQIILNTGKLIRTCRLPLIRLNSILNDGLKPPQKLA